MRRGPGKSTIELAGDRDRRGGDREDVADNDSVPTTGDDVAQAGAGGGSNDDEILLGAPCAFPAHSDRAARSGGGGDVLRGARLTQRRGAVVRNHQLPADDTSVEDLNSDVAPAALARSGFEMKRASACRAPPDDPVDVGAFLPEYGAVSGEPTEMPFQRSARALSADAAVTGRHGKERRVFGRCDRRPVRRWRQPPLSASVLDRDACDLVRWILQHR